MAQRKALDVDEEEALVAEEEALLASADTHARTHVIACSSGRSARHLQTRGQVTCTSNNGVVVPVVHASPSVRYANS